MTVLTRRNFRVFLGIMLILSAGFFSAVTYYERALENNDVDVSSIRPILFKADIYGHYAKSYIISRDEKLVMAKELFRKGMFDRSYRDAGMDMMTDLAESGHAPTQVYFADILISFSERETAEKYYKAAAKQGYRPAQQKIAFLNIE